MRVLATVNNFIYMSLEWLPELPYASEYSSGLSVHIKPHSNRQEKPHQSSFIPLPPKH